VNISRGYGTAATCIFELTKS